jgi:hypothetical protein
VIIPPRVGRGADALIQRDGSLVVVEIKGYSASPGSTSTRRLLEQVDSLIDAEGAIGAIVVSRMPIVLSEQMPPKNVSVAIWRTQNDDRELELALELLMR